MNFPIIISVICILLLILLRFSAFDSTGSMSCKNFLGNNLLFITFAISLIVLFYSLQYQFTNPLTSFFVDRKNTLQRILISILFLIILLVLTFLMYSSQSRLLCFFFWILILFVFSLLLFPIFQSLQLNQNLLLTISIQLILLFSFFTFLGFTSPNLFNRTKIFPILLGVLILLILSHLLSFFLLVTDKKESFLTVRRILAIIGVALFSLFIWFDAGSLELTKKYCTSKNVNYMKSSFQLILDIVNLFMNLFNAQN